MRIAVLGLAILSLISGAVSAETVYNTGTCSGSETFSSDSGLSLSCDGNLLLSNDSWSSDSSIHISATGDLSLLNFNLTAKDIYLGAKGKLLIEDGVFTLLDPNGNVLLNNGGDITITNSADSGLSIDGHPITIKIEPPITNGGVGPLPDGSGGITLTSVPLPSAVNVMVVGLLGIFSFAVRGKSNKALG